MRKTGQDWTGRRIGRVAGALLALVSVLAVGATAATVSTTASPKVAGASSNASTYVAITPTRYTDTRTWFAPTAGSVTPVTITGGTIFGVPTNATAVQVNITVTDTQTPGYITAFPHQTTQPLASTVNFSAGQTVANSAILPLNNGGIDLYNGSSGTVDLIVDVFGYFIPASGTPSGALTSLAPDRILDTRDGTGAAAGAVASNGIISLQAVGTDTIPSGATAAVLNVTVTEPTAPGYITVWGEGTSQPLASNLNFVPGQTVPNLVIAPIGPDGKIDLYNGSAGSVQLIADVTGCISGTGAPVAGSYVAVTPTRLFDTRDGTGLGGPDFAGPVDDQYFIQADTTMGGGVIPAGAEAAVVNITVADTQDAGYVTAFADDVANVPLASNVNYVANEVVPNLGVVPLGSTNLYDFLVSGGTTDLIVDAFGYFHG